MSRHRRSRLGEQLRRELSLKIDTLVRDPGLGSVTVTGVDVTTDLWLARVYVEAHGSTAEQSESMAALRRAAPFLRSVIGRELHIRRMPELRFYRDESIEAGQRIEAILREVLPVDGAGEGGGTAPRSGPGEDGSDVGPARADGHEADSSHAGGCEAGGCEADGSVADGSVPDGSVADGSLAGGDHVADTATGKGTRER